MKKHESLTQAQLPSGSKTCGANNKQKGREYICFTQPLLQVELPPHKIKTKTETPTAPQE